MSTLSGLLSNQFTSGGLLLMLLGAAMGLLRKLPDAIYAWLKNRFSVNLTIVDTDLLFEWTRIWLDSLQYSRRARSISCSLHVDADEEFTTDSRVIFAPAYGSHFFRHGHHLIWLSREKSEAPPGGTKASGLRLPETIRLTVLGTDQKILRNLVNEITASAKQLQQRRVRGYISGRGWWRRLPTFSPRLLDTVFLPEHDERRMVGAISEFLVSRAIYTKRGIPYHLNFLLAGPPGTGKTSVTAALCGHFGLNLYVLNIGAPGINDDTLVDLMLSIPRRSLLLLEDIDAVLPEARVRKPKSNKNEPSDDDSGVTLSGLLNCMDGITAPDGSVIVMTTNHPEKLDQALLRAGRVDHRIDFGMATWEQIERMARSLGVGVPDIVLESKMTTAQVQAFLLSAAVPMLECASGRADRALEARSGA